MFARFDECKEDEALWLLQEIEERRQNFEESLKIVLLTTAGSSQDGRICEALSKIPADSVTTVDYSDEKSDAIDTGLVLSALLQDDPRYADRSIAQRVAEIITHCEDDNDLVLLFITVLTSSANHERLVESLISDKLTPVSGRIFERALSEIADEHRPWAKLILSWMSAAVRPLRVHEFHLLSEMCARDNSKDARQHAEDQLHPKVRYEVDRAIERFHGLLRVENDEIHFSHRRIRPWLISQSIGQNSPNQWYCKQSKHGDHKDILDICLNYLGRLAEHDESNPSFSYIIEHWTHHYKLVEGSKVEWVLEQVLTDTTALSRWITLYKALPTPPLKPLAGTPGALDIAAHFSLDDCVELLTATGTYQRDAWGTAILEAVRVAELSTVQLLFQSLPHTLKFNDEDFQDIVRHSLKRGDPKIAMEVIGRIPKASEPIPDWKTLKAKTDNVVSGVDDMGTSGDSMPQDEVCGGATTAARPDDSSKPRVTEGDQETDPVQTSPFNWLGPLLCEAAELGPAEAVSTLLALGADPNTRPKKGQSTRSALSGPCVRGHEEILRILLDNGADIESRTGTGNNLATPLYLACDWGNLGVVRLLLERGASVLAKHEDGWTPLHVAAQWGADSCVDALLEHKRFDEYLSADDPAPLPLAVRNGRYKTAETLLRHGFDPESHDTDGTALWLAVETGRVDLCRLLLDYKADPNAHIEDSAPPLGLAIKNYKMDIIKMLVEKGADVEKPGRLGAFHGTPILMAVLWNSNPEILEYLLERKADFNVQNKAGWSPLWQAVWWKVSYLLRPYLAPDQQADYLNQKVEFVRVLCKAGADVNLICNGRTPLHASMAKSDGDLEVVRVLLDHGADVNKFVEGWGTPVRFVPPKASRKRKKKK